MILIYDPALSVSYISHIYDHDIHDITSWYDILASGDIKLSPPDLIGEKVSNSSGVITLDLCVTGRPVDDTKTQHDPLFVVFCLCTLSELSLYEHT